MFPKYEYPSFPNVETRQLVTGGLRDGTLTPVQYAPPGNVVVQNVNPNPYTPESNQEVYGTQNFGLGYGYEEFPQNVDIVHREISLQVNHPLLYRGNLGVGLVAARNERIMTPSYTAPQSSATFLNGRRGDVYGN